MYVKSSVLALQLVKDFVQLSDTDAKILYDSRWWEDERFEPYEISLFVLMMENGPQCIEWDSFVDIMNLTMNAVVLGRALVPLREQWIQFILQRLHDGIILSKSKKESIVIP